MLHIQPATMLDCVKYIESRLYPANYLSSNLFSKCNKKNQWYIFLQIPLILTFCFNLHYYMLVKTSLMTSSFNTESLWFTLHPWNGLLVSECGMLKLRTRISSMAALCKQQQWHQKSGTLNTWRLDSFCAVQQRHSVWRQRGILLPLHGSIHAAAKWSVHVFCVLNFCYHCFHYHTVAMVLLHHYCTTNVESYTNKITEYMYDMHT